MQRPQASSERTPLVPPTYAFESSLSRSYQKRLRNFQCAICILLIVFLTISLMVTVSYNLVPDTEPTSEPVTAEPSNLTTILTLSKDLEPILNKNWPLDGPPPKTWVGNTPTSDHIMDAVSKGKEALKKRKMMEGTLKPLDSNSPASRAQRAAATASAVKPLAEAAFAAEEATRVLVNGTDKTLVATGVGLGPHTNSSFDEPAYCRPPTTPCVISKYRTQDGSCNNLEHPITWGVSNTPFRRVLPAVYGDGISSPRQSVDGTGLPSARDVSVTVHRPSYAHDSSFTVMLAVWGQFIDHDITATALSKGENSSSISCCSAEGVVHPECFPVRLDVEDPFYQNYNVTCMEFVRSASAPTCHFGPREQLNQASAFLDGSTVYSPSDTKMKQLRAGLEGQLRMLKVGPWELLPPSMDPNDGCNTVEMNAKGRYCFESGDDRANENLHLTTMHLIWARQHNRLAVALQELNPHWDDERVFQEARRILGAQMQHITYSEFLPLILGQDVMFTLNLTLQEEGYSDAYDPKVDPSIANHFSAAAFRFAHTLLPGLIHNVDSNNGTVSYTHLHEMLFNPFALYSVDKGPRFAMKSAMDTPVHTVDPHITSELTEHLFERPSAANSSTASAPAMPCGLDLVSLNIQRGRDHGLPAYPAWRHHCGFDRPTSFDDLALIFDDLSLGRISTIYKNVDDIDLYTGALAEDPKGRLLGPTLTCLVADQFLRIKIGDRFWYETSDANVAFTIEQLVEIRKTTLAGVICANEDLLDQAQPRVMEALSATNPLVDCTELPQPTFEPWQEIPPEGVPIKKPPKNSKKPKKSKKIPGTKP